MDFGIKKLRWSPKLTILSAVELATRELLKN